MWEMVLFWKGKAPLEPDSTIPRDPAIVAYERAFVMLGLDYYFVPEVVWDEGQG